MVGPPRYTWVVRSCDRVRSSEPTDAAAAAVLSGAIRPAAGSEVCSAAGGGFTATGGELIQGLRGNFSPAGFANGLTSDGVQGGTGLLTGAVGTGNVDNHSQLRWRLLGATRSPVPSAGNVIDDGLYLAVLKVSAYADASATTPYAASLPYALLFEKNAGGTVTTADEANARAVVAANVVPEPTGLIGLVGGVYAVTRRRRTATV